MSNVVLICTVGGSHEPIVTSIKQTKPDFVCFVCSDNDPATLKPGSENQITGKGNFIKAKKEDEKSSLPNIPTQAGLSEGSFEILMVPADALDSAFLKTVAKLRELRSRFPQARILADYTGGTKTMTAALVTGAIECEGVELHLVTGRRGDLIAVESGSEFGIPVNVERMRLEREMRVCLEGWQQFAYGAAAASLSSLLSRVHDQELRAALTRARDISRAFDAWDRFDHAKALTLFQDYGPVVGPDYAPYFSTLKSLTSEPEKQFAQREGARLADLGLNAQRRAARGRYDDAVSRLYRLIEGTAQWILKSKCNIDTSDVPAAECPESITLEQNSKGKFEAGLFQAWCIVREKNLGRPSEFFKEQGGTLLNHLEIRNSSILAHGFRPITEREWEKLRLWMEQSFIPMLKHELKQAGVRWPEQLPTSYEFHKQGET